MSLEAAERAIDQEIERLRRQVNRLEAALSHLDGTSTTKPIPSARKTRASATNGRPRKRTTKRIPASQRQEQVLSIIKKRPGIRPSDLAREADITAAYASSIIKTLETDKKVKRSDGGLLAR